MRDDVSRAYQFACLKMMILIDCYRVVNSIINFITTLLLKKFQKICEGYSMTPTVEYS